LLLLFTLPVVTAALAFDQKHGTLSAELAKYVDHSGVHYRKWKADEKGLSKYLSELAALDPQEYEHFSLGEKKALWVNAYNALIIKIVLDHYPVHGDKSYYPPDSARQIPHLWEDYHARIAGRDINLYDIEHKIIRKFCDPRLHFVVVCAARGCPDLRNSAYTAATFEADLDEAARRYVGQKNNVQFDLAHKTVSVSKLFQWFPLDFADPKDMKKHSGSPLSDDEIVLSYLLKYAPEGYAKEVSDLKSVHVIYMPYDWSLNDADKAQVDGNPR
jgi:hypothetical protein